MQGKIRRSLGMGLAWLLRFLLSVLCSSGWRWVVVRRKMAQSFSFGGNPGLERVKKYSPGLFPGLYGDSFRNGLIFAGEQQFLPRRLCYRVAMVVALFLLSPVRRAGYFISAAMASAMACISSGVSFSLGLEIIMSLSWLMGMRCMCVCGTSRPITATPTRLQGMAFSMA